MERMIFYKKYRIEANVHQIDGNRDPEHMGKWIASDYAIGKIKYGGYTEKMVVHKPQYYNSEEEAIKATWLLAKEGIDRGHVEI